MTVPLPAPPRLDEVRVQKRVLVFIVLGAMFGASATVAAVIGATHDVRQSDQTQKDLEQNQRLLDSVCENARTLTETFTTASPQPCPTAK